MYETRDKYLSMTHEELCKEVSDSLYAYLSIDYSSLPETEFYYAEEWQERRKNEKTGIPDEDIKAAYIKIQEYNKAKKAMESGTVEQYLSEPVSQTVDKGMEFLMFKRTIKRMYPENFDYKHIEALNEVVSKYEYRGKKQNLSSEPVTEPEIEEVIEHVEIKYPQVNIQEYVRQGLETGVLDPFEAEKFARIVARQGEIGEQVITWSEDKDGKEIHERVDNVKLDEETNEPGWVVTKVDENGETIIDRNGHPNQWIIGDSKFKAKYEVDSENPSLFRPIGGPQTFVELPQGITLEQGEKIMAIDAGGFVNITNPEDMYGISKRDFEDTYKRVQALNKTSSL